jgi:hypothetical protein
VQSLRKLIEHLIATIALACFRQLDARVDQILLQLRDLQLRALRRADVIAQNATEHETHGRAHGPTDDRSRSRTGDAAHTFFLRELVLLRRLHSTTSQRHRHRHNQGFLKHSRAPT